MTEKADVKAEIVKVMSSSASNRLSSITTNPLQAVGEELSVIVESPAIMSSGPAGEKISVFREREREGEEEGEGEEEREREREMERKRQKKRQTD